MLIPFGVLSAAGAGGVVAGDYELISTTILGTAASSVTFSSLGTYSSTYKHLQLRIAARSSSASSFSGRLRFNGDTGANYSFHQLLGNGSSVLSTADSGQTGTDILPVSNSNSTASSFAGAVIDILDSYSTTKNTTLRTLAGFAVTAVYLRSGAWYNTASVTSIDLYMQDASNFIAGSRFSLYGIKG